MKTGVIDFWDLTALGEAAMASGRGNQEARVASNAASISDRRNRTAFPILK